MMRHEIVPCDRDVWNIFLPTISHPIDSSVHFLISYLVTKSLPENYQPSLLSSMATEGQHLYPLRSQLLDWLLPPCPVMDGTMTTKPRSDLDPDVVGHALALLVMKNPSFVTILPENDCCFVTGLERVYLETSHDFPLCRRKVTKKTSTVPNKDDMLLSVLLRRMEDNFKENANSLLEFLDPQAADIQVLAKEACLVVKFVYWLLRYNLISLDSLSSMDLISVLKSLLKKLGTLLSDVQQNQGVVELWGVLPWIQRILQWEGSDRSEVIVARLVRSLLPAKVIDTLLDVAMEVVSEVSGHTVSSSCDINAIYQCCSIKRS